jgi:hypothetical protein
MQKKCYIFPIKKASGLTEAFSSSRNWTPFASVALRSGQASRPASCLKIKCNKKASYFYEAFPSSGNWTRTSDLRVMSPTSYLLLYPAICITCSTLSFPVLSEIEGSKCTRCKFQNSLLSFKLSAHNTDRFILDCKDTTVFIVS